MRGQEIHCRLTAAAASDDHLVEVSVRKAACFISAPTIFASAFGRIWP
jgi:hypothetical protein